MGRRKGRWPFIRTSPPRLTAVAESLDYRRRPKVVVTSLDFPTVAYQWLARAGDGVEVEIVESPDGIGVPVDAVARAVDDRTALVATSHVFFTSGAIQDVRALADVAHAKGALLLVDGYHAAGQLPVDVQRARRRFYCSGGLKWMIGGTGIAFMYARPELWPTLAPRATGWFAHRDQFRFNARSFEPHDDARRLEGGHRHSCRSTRNSAASTCSRSWAPRTSAGERWRSPKT